MKPILEGGLLTMAALSFSAPFAAAQEPLRATDIPETTIVSIASTTDDLFAASYTDIYHSADGGLNWTPTSVLPVDTSDVNTLLIHDGVLYAGTNGSGVFASANNGASWTTSAPGLSGLSLRVVQLAVLGDSLFAATDGGGIRVLDLSAPNQWHGFNQSLPAQGMTALVASGQRLVASGGPSGSVYVRHRQGAAWTTVPLDEEDPQNQAYDLHSSGPFLLAGTAKGIYRSTKEAAEWMHLENALPASADVMAISAYGERIFASAVHQGVSLFSSDDFGATWTLRHQGGMPVYDLHGSHERLWIGRDDGLWYLDLSTSPKLFHATLFAHLDGYPVGRGSVLATLDGGALHLMGYFSGLTAPWIQVDLYRGDPAEGGEQTKTLFFTVPEGGGSAGSINTTADLTETELEQLMNGEMYLHVKTLGTEAQHASGALASLPLLDPIIFETEFSTISGGALQWRGNAAATLEGDDLRIIAFGRFEQTILQATLYRGSMGGEREHLAALWSNFLGGSDTVVGFDRTLPLTQENKQDLLDGRLHVTIDAVGTSSTGWIYPASNEAPAAPAITTPENGATIMIGGESGEDPLNTDVLLADVTFPAVDDPDGQTVAYIWQLSRTSDFQAGSTGALELGTDSTSFPLTVATAAALFDTTWAGFPSIPLHTPTTFYHRIITTDGAAYAFGPASSLTLSRGTITSSEPRDGVPARFVLHGNYPNPFNPTTTIRFDLPATADVRVEIFNLLGQRVLTVPAGRMTAGAARHIEIDASSISSGGYIYRVVMAAESGVEVAAGRMMVVK